MQTRLRPHEAGGGRWRCERKGWFLNRPRPGERGGGDWPVPAPDKIATASFEQTAVAPNVLAAITLISRARNCHRLD